MNFPKTVALLQGVSDESGGAGNTVSEEEFPPNLSGASEELEPMLAGFSEEELTELGRKACYLSVENGKWVDPEEVLYPEALPSGFPVRAAKVIELWVG